MRRCLGFSLVMAASFTAVAMPLTAQAAAGVAGISSSGLFQPTLTAMSDVNQVSYTARTVTFSGELTATPPGGGPAVPEPGFVVYFTPAKGAPVPVATTQSDGTYSGAVNNVAPGTFRLTTKATTTVAAAQSNPVVITGIYVPLNFRVVTVKPTKLKYGESATLTGIVDLGPGSAALAGAVVRVTDGSVKLPKAITDASGKFSVKFSTVHGQDLELTASDSNPLLTPESIGIGVQIQYPLKSQLFKAKLEGNGAVMSSICLLTSPLGFSQLQLNAVELQYAPTGHGPWRKLGMIPGVEPFSAPKSCQVGGWSYFNDREAPIPGRLIDAYYRVVVPASTIIEAFSSKVVHSFLSRSKVTSFSIIPHAVNNGGHLSLTGHLARQQGRKWRAYGHQRIVILARPKRRKDWSAVATARTNAVGRFSVRLTAGAGKGKLVFQVLFPGNGRYLWSVSRQITISFNESATAARSASGGVRSLLILPHPTAELARQRLPDAIR
jgi:hypothetical protein